MNWHNFRTTFLWGLCATAFLSGYVAATARQAAFEMALIVAILMLLITILLSIYVAMDKSKPVKHREPRARMTENEQRNALLFKHQPLRAQFEVRSAAARQQSGRSTARRI